MGFPVTRTDVLRLTMKGTVEANLVINVLHFASVNAWNDAAPNPDSTVLLTDFIGQYRIGVLQRVGVKLQVIDYRLQTIVGWTPGTPPAFNPLPLFVNTETIAGDPVMDKGQRAGDALPNFAAYSAIFRTARSGRRWRGGNRFMPVLEVDTGDNFLTPGVVTDWSTVGLPNLTQNLIDPATPVNQFSCGIFSLRNTVLTQAAGANVNTRTNCPFLVSTVMNSLVGHQDTRKLRIFV